ncbi:peptidase S53 [Trinickia symbiotica]|uniref:Peptidase S53 n=2 Tax=Trinickia symbiotica TaxID=863227 RepID=A0A2T3XUR2_9BURK|nr:peptidase S53 [Trinickia symbiotica]
MPAVDSHGVSSGVANQGGQMDSTAKPKQSMSKWRGRAAMALPLFLATVSAHAAGASTNWVDTATKGFLTPAQLRTFSAAPQTETRAGEPIRVVVSMKAHDFGKLRDLADAVTRRANPSYHQFLTPQAFLERYAPTPRQVERVVAYLRENGLVNIAVSRNRMLISADGTSGTVKRAFHTPIVHFMKGGRLVHANTRTAQVPEGLADSVLAVLGLQNVTRAHTMAVRGPRAQADTRAAAGTAKGHAPKEFSAIYQADSLPSASNTTIGIVTIGGASQATSDLAQFTSANNLSPVNVSTVNTGASNGNYDDDPNGQVEWDLDSQDIVGAAGGAVRQLIFYAADLNAPGNTGLTQAFNQAVTDGVAKVINVSLGWCEADAYTDGTMAAEDQIFTAAVAQGQTFSVSSGDEGAYECNNRGFPDGGTYSLSWPASSPNVISVGGTTLYTQADGSFANETVWNEGLDGDGKLWASTGGFSAFEPTPVWQRALNVSPRPAGRAVPDISFDAAQSTGALIYTSNGVEQVGGTSLSSPLFVGFWARLESAHSNSLGFPASSLYSAVAATPSLAFDVTSGNNGYGGYGYNAGPRWDYPTGWGSLRMKDLAVYVERYPFAR